MKPKPHGRYLAQAKRATAPVSVFAVEVETTDQIHAGNLPTVQRRFASAIIIHSEWRHGAWSRPVEVPARSPEAVFAVMESLARRDRLNWVVCTGAANTLTLLRYWHELDINGLVSVGRRNGVPDLPRDHATTDIYYIDSLHLSGASNCIGWTRRGVRWRWVSAANYFPAGVGPEKGDTGGERGMLSVVPDLGGTVAGASDSAARANHGALTGLCSWWRANARSAFGTTIGQLSVGILRTHVAAKALCSHVDDDAHALERAACFGGRASVWFAGCFGEYNDYTHTGPSVPRLGPGVTDGPALTQVDVRSMYPYLLRERPYPCDLRGYLEDVPVRDCLDMAREMSTISRVTIETDVGEYPYRKGERVLYPTGRFTTTLTGPELLQLASEGKILACHAQAQYRTGRPFATAVDALLDARRSAEDATDARGATFAKLLANSLAGKLAQRAGGWIRNPDEDSPGWWGEGHIIDAQTGALVRVRHVTGLCWRWADEPSGKGPYTFAFAYLAAYGRLMMRRIREMCPPRSVVSQDTDGLWVTPDGIEALGSAGMADEHGPGSLRIVGTASSGRFWGPRHYLTDDQWTLAGFSRPVVDSDHRSIYDEYDQSVWSTRHRAAPDFTIGRARASHLTLHDVGGKVGEDGWVAPPVFDHNSHMEGRNERPS